MRTKQALRKFIASRGTANLNPATVYWYQGQFVPIAMSSSNLPAVTEPLKGFLAGIRGGPQTRGQRFQALKTFFQFKCQGYGIPHFVEGIDFARHPRGECLP